ncbi:hypothetical protein chiPu_0031162, partial [Chiloscyllium punctatum]|nr:hypothetical protein [Chiloscyllium punctatum]
MPPYSEKNDLDKGEAQIETVEPDSQSQAGGTEREGENLEQEGAEENHDSYKRYLPADEGQSATRKAVQRILKILKRKLNRGALVRRTVSDVKAWRVAIRPVIP